MRKNILKDKNGVIVNLHVREYGTDDIPVDFTMDLKDKNEDFSHVLVQDGTPFELDLHAEKGWRQIPDVDCREVDKEECRRRVKRRLEEEDDAQF